MPAHSTRTPRARCATSTGGLGPQSCLSLPAAKWTRWPIFLTPSMIAWRIGATVASQALGAPHVGERSEKELILSFVHRIAELSPQLVTFNGSSFDLPVLRYRAMVHGVAAPGLSLRPYFNRFSEDAVDLCDVLSSFSAQGKATLHELCRVLGLPDASDLIGFFGTPIGFAPTSCP
jgi:Predicted 3'-5' exonuclease related to the exonuclease domain of PolB